jgi:tRNA-dihydrouridine synthase 1
MLLVSPTPQLCYHLLHNLPSDLNLGCPQKKAQDGHFGGYLILRRDDWVLVEAIVAALVSKISVPIHVKLRLCSPATLTAPLCLRVAKQGASVVTLHARHVSARRRRKGPADLDRVKELVELFRKEGLSTRIISNGNVRRADDLAANIEATGAAGIMVGEPLLENPKYPSSSPIRHAFLISVLEGYSHYRMTVTLLALPQITFNCVSTSGTP